MIIGSGMMCFENVMVDVDNVIDFVCCFKYQIVFYQLFYVVMLVGIGYVIVCDVGEFVCNCIWVYSYGNVLCVGDDVQLQQVIGEIVLWVYVVDVFVLCVVQLFQYVYEVCFGGDEVVEQVVNVVVEIEFVQSQFVVFEFVLCVVMCLFDVFGVLVICSMIVFDCYWCNVCMVLLYNLFVYKVCIVGDWIINGCMLLFVWCVGNGVDVYVGVSVEMGVV